MRLGFLGTGTIATAVVRGIAADGHNILVSERGRANSSRLAREHPNIAVAENRSVVSNSDTVFLGSTASAAVEMLEPLDFGHEQEVISFMVGIDRDEINDLVAPARCSAVMIPFPSIARGGSPVLTFPASEIVETLFGRQNTVIALDSADDFNEFLSAQAVLSPIAMMLATASDWLGSRTGNCSEAERFLRQLIASSLLPRPVNGDDSLRDLLDSLNTPGGLNQQLRNHVGDHGSYDNLVKGLDILSERMSRPS